MVSDSSGHDNDLCVPPNAPSSCYFDEEEQEDIDPSLLSGERSPPVVTVQRISNIELPSEEAGIFEYFLQWLYTRKLDDESRSKNMSTWTSLAKLHILADKYGIPQLKNDTIDKLVHKRLGHTRDEFEWGADGKRLLGSSTAIVVIAKNCLPESALRRLVADFIAWSPTKKLKEEGPFIPPEFLLDVTLILAGLREDRAYTKEPPYMKRVCKAYHEHNQTFPILKTCE
ncbi:MAG: hypothetical protein M1812_001304 [Candelaria pacifica]|nr:MAG: hypothetical protein M1812_001304 [Candelaria pacifica]